MGSNAVVAAAPRRPWLGTSKEAALRVGILLWVVVGLLATAQAQAPALIQPLPLQAIPFSYQSSSPCGIDAASSGSATLSPLVPAFQGMRMRIAWDDALPGAGIPNPTLRLARVAAAGTINDGTVSGSDLALAEVALDFSVVLTPLHDAAFDSGITYYTTATIPSDLDVGVYVLQWVYAAPTGTVFGCSALDMRAVALEADPVTPHVFTAPSDSNTWAFFALVDAPALGFSIRMDRSQNSYGALYVSRGRIPAFGNHDEADTSPESHLVETHFDYSWEVGVDMCSVGTGASAPSPDVYYIGVKTVIEDVIRPMPESTIAVFTVESPLVTAGETGLDLSVSQVEASFMVLPPQASTADAPATLVVTAAEPCADAGGEALGTAPTFSVAVSDACGANRPATEHPSRGACTVSAAIADLSRVEVSGDTGTYTVVLEAPPAELRGADSHLVTIVVVSVVVVMALAVLAVVVVLWKRPRNSASPYDPIGASGDELKEGGKQEEAVKGDLDGPAEHPLQTIIKPTAAASEPAEVFGTKPQFPPSWSTTTSSGEWTNESA